MFSPPAAINAWYKSGDKCSPHPCEDNADHAAHRLFAALLSVCDHPRSHSRYSRLLRWLARFLPTGWPRYLSRSGQPHGYQIVPHIVPYKRAVAMVARQEGDMAMSVYLDEIKGVKQPHQPASADDVTVFMLKQWQPQWRGERSLEGETVLWRRGWVLDKYLPVTMRWHEIDNHEMALQLIGKGRYRYYLTAGVLHSADETPANMYRTILRWIPTYPIFADTEQGDRLLQLWDQEMVNLIRRGTLAEIYRRYHLYDYYRDFLEEQAVKAGEN